MVKGFGLSPTKKFGSLIGDDVKTMINASLMPGSVVEKGGVVYSGRF
jgi:NDP-sugar pyrophosphorylase family protein